MGITTTTFPGRAVDVGLALASAWPDVTFDVAAAPTALSVAWTDGPGRRAVLNEARMCGWGVSALHADRTLSPAGLVRLLRSGVRTRDLDDMPIDALETGLADDVAMTVVAAGLADARIDVRRALVAFARLPPDELRIAVVLAGDDPTMPFAHVVQAAKALAHGI